MISKIAKLSISTALGLVLAFGGVSASQADTVAQSTNIVAGSIATKDKAAIAAYKAARAEYRQAMADYKITRAGYKAQLAAYRAVMTELRPALKAYAAAKKVINQTFATTVKAARETYKAVLAANPTPEVALEAKNVFAAAKATAVGNRAAALASLGAPPVKPAAPVKPVKPVKPVRP